MSEVGLGVRVSRICLLLPLASLGLAGCGAAATAPKPVTALEIPVEIVVDIEPLDVESLLARGQEHLAAQQWVAAAQNFRTVAEQAVGKKDRLRGLHGWGTALDMSGDPGGALKVYRRFTEESPPGQAHDSMTIRVVRLLVYLERYAEAGELEPSVKMGQRVPLEQVALFAAQALHALEQDRLTDAQKSITRGRSVIDAHSLDRVRVPPLDVAALYFAQGQYYSLQASQIGFDPVPPDFSIVLEKRCQLILDAQGAFSESMRSEDAHWSSMSGVKVGELYQDLHRDLVNMPTPAAADTLARRQLFEGAMRLRYAILLTKSLAMMRSTVDLLDRTEQKSPWRAKARLALEEIEASQQREELAIDALPFSRAELQRVLDDMAARARSDPGREGS